MFHNKVFLISSPFVLCLLILNAVVWIGVFGVLTEQRADSQVLAPIAPVAEKSEPKTEQERDLTVFGASVTNYARTQVRFLEGLEASPSKDAPWKHPYDPQEPPVNG